jgi:hypothetical protein
MVFRNKKIRLTAVFLLLVLGGSCTALDAARRSTMHFQIVAQNKNASQMERLIVALVGSWITEDIYEARDQASRPRLEHARESYRVGPTRLSLIEEYHGQDNAGKQWETGVFWWDGGVQGARVLWCDNSRPDIGCRILSGVGKWEGGNFVQTDVQEKSGKQIFRREVWSDFKPASFTQTIYQGETLGALRRVLTIKATRISPLVRK